MIYEAVRTKINNKESVVVRFSQRHDSNPFVTTTLESSDSGGINCFTTALSQTSVTVNFSSNFNGYLHLHACSNR